MIPKTIHYCWFGRGEKSRLMKKCMRSWKKYCPDYEFIEWNEDNFDVNSTLWTKQAYGAKKYAFVADYVRLWALYHYGGVYMDTDQELIKPLEPFMEYEGFMGFINMADQDRQGILNMGVIGVNNTGVAHSLVSDLMSYYEHRSFISNGIEDKLPNTDLITDIFREHGLVQDEKRQSVADFEIYPPEVFCPTSCVSIHDCKTKETVAIHHWAMTWRKKSEIKTYARVRRRQRWWYRALFWLRYLPNRVVRKLFGDVRIDRLKQRMGK